MPQITIFNCDTKHNETYLFKMVKVKDCNISVITDANIIITIKGKIVEVKGAI